MAHNVARAVMFDRFGPPEVLAVRDVPVAAPSGHELLVRVEAAGVNFRDVQIRRGRLQPDLVLPARIGIEGAGTVVEIGSNVSDFDKGDKVAWVAAEGSYANLICVRESDAVQVPSSVTTEIAGALLAQGLTAHYLTADAHHVVRDETVVVLAAAGGVGRLVVQIATAHGARVLGVVSTPAKADEARAAGAEDVVVGYERIPAAVAEFTSGVGADVVYDGVGGIRFADSLKSVRSRGAVVLFGTAAGEPPSIEVRDLATAGSVTLMRPRLHDFIATRSALLQRSRSVFDWAARGNLDVRIENTYPLEQAATAHKALEQRTVSGKLLLCP